jgi:hypothetical protein
MRSAAEKNLPASSAFIFLCAFSILAFALNAGESQKIIDKEMTVLRGDFKEVHYLIRPENAGDKIQGSFTCKGGFYDDVNFYVFTKDQYVRWYSNYSNNPIVKLEKKKEGKFEFSVQPEETYYFVFDNFFSTISNKQVKLQVHLLDNAKTQ